MELEQEGVTGWHEFHRGAQRSENVEFAELFESELGD